MIQLALAPRQRPDPQRYQTWGGRVGNRNPDEYDAWLKAASLLVRTLWKGRPQLAGPVRLDVVFVIPPPKKEAARLAGLPCARRPDLDRYVHAIQDAITQAGNVWEDDARVCRLDASKRYAYAHESPCVLFEVSVEART